MLDYLYRFKGPFDQKVDELLTFFQNTRMKIPEIQEDGEELKSENEIRKYYDYSPAEFRRRKRGTINCEKKAQKELYGLADPKIIRANFAFGNAMIMRGGYNAVDHNRFVTLAAAIWILDQLSMQNCLDKIYPYLPDDEDQDPVCMYVSHPDYDFELIKATVRLLLYRNKDSYSGLKPNESTIEDFKNRKKESPKLQMRKNFEAVMGLLDSEAIRQVTEQYEKDVWEFYRIAFSAILCMQKKEESIELELAGLDKKVKSIKQEPMPTMVMNLSGIPLFSEASAKEKQELLVRKRVLQAQLDEIQHSGYFTEFSLVNSREKVSKKFKNIIGSNTRDKLLHFSVSDPFASAFALFWLLDQDSNIPWCYYGSISVAYTFVDQLPFDIAPLASGEKTYTEDLNDLLYQIRYAGIRREGELDCFNEPVERSLSRNLSQIIYSTCLSLIPRVSYTVPAFEEVTKDLELENTEKDLYKMILYLLDSKFLESETLTSYRLQNSESILPETDTKDLKQSDPEELQTLRKKNSELTSAFYEETRLRKQGQRRLSELEKENGQMHRELADLRDLIFLLNSNGKEESQEETAEVSFPIHTKGKILSFGGHPFWLTEMKKMLPDVKFYSPDVIPNTDALKMAEEVWIQTNCISHGSYYRIINFLEGYQVQLRYFSYSSAKKCAVQLAKNKM